MSILLCSCLYGGAPRSLQLRELLHEPQLAVACPGRLLDFVDSGEMSLKSVGPGDRSDQTGSSHHLSAHQSVSGRVVGELRPNTFMWQTPSED